MADLKQGDIAALDELIHSSKKIIVTAHTHPDGDAVGSVTAMRSYLQSRGADVTAVLPDAYPDTISFIDSDKRTVFSPSSLEADLIIVLDMNTAKRAGELENALNESKAKKVLIDHHLNPDRDFFDLVFSETEVSSTCELLYSILKRMPDVNGDLSRLPALCKNALMTGMTTDSNNFDNSVYPDTLRMAADLIEAGVDREEILHNLYQEYRENRLRAISFLLYNKLKICDNGFAYIILDKDTANRFDLGDGETEKLVNIPLEVNKVTISALLKEDDGHYRVSLRSKRGTTVNGMAEKYCHGGGHPQAAGGKVFFPEDIMDKKDINIWLEEKAAQFLQDSHNWKI